MDWNVESWLRSWLIDDWETNKDVLYSGKSKDWQTKLNWMHWKPVDPDNGPVSTYKVMADGEKEYLYTEPSLYWTEVRPAFKYGRTRENEEKWSR